MPSTRGLFIVGTDTDVGKTYVAARIVRQLVAAGKKVGVYKPAASGCRHDSGELVSDDAIALWEAAGRPGSLSEGCPQRFTAALAPNVAAHAEGRAVDDNLLRHGLEVWRERSDVVVVEGVGGWFSPLSDTTLVADLAREFALPVVIVAHNALGTINHTLLTVDAVQRTGLKIAAVVLNDAQESHDDSAATNRLELSQRLSAPLVSLPWQGMEFVPPVNWLELIEKRESL